MLYVTIVNGDSRTTRGRYETDDPAEAVRQALAKVDTSMSTGSIVLGVLVEEQGTQLDKADLAEQFEVLRTKESRRADGLPARAPGG